MVLLEKRVEYTRHVWFDLTDEPWGATQATLRAWGLESQRGAQTVRHAGHSIVSIRAAMLERFLSKVALAIGVELRYGVEYLGVCREQAASRLWVLGANATASERPVADTTQLCARLHGVEHNRMSDIQWIQADLLIGADGANSRVRFDSESAHVSVGARY